MLGAALTFLKTSGASLVDAHFPFERAIARPQESRERDDAG